MRLLLMDDVTTQISTIPFNQAETRRDSGLPLSACEPIAPVFAGYGGQGQAAVPTR